MDNGIDPEKHEFHLTKNAPLAKRQSVNSAPAAAVVIKKEDDEEEETNNELNQEEEVAQQEEAEEEEEVAEVSADLLEGATDAEENDAVQLIEDDDELMVKTDVDEGDEVVDEVGEVDEVTEVPDFEVENDEPTAVSLETSNNVIDNEDSLNLTIGEDEEKIFQDEVSFNVHF